MGIPLPPVLVHVLAAPNREVAAHAQLPPFTSMGILSTVEHIYSHKGERRAPFMRSHLSARLQDEQGQGQGDTHSRDRCRPHLRTARGHVTNVQDGNTPAFICHYDCFFFYNIHLFNTIWFPKYIDCYYVKDC